MNFTKIADGNAGLVDDKVVMFMIVDADGKYDFAPGFRRDNQYFFPDGYPMATEVRPVEWAFLPQLPQGCQYSWE